MSIQRPPWYYRALIGAVMPLYQKKVRRKSATLPTLSRELDERFYGIYGDVPVAHDHDKGIIWCHAVSLGELNTAYPLLTYLLAQGYRLWITSTTQTGFNRAQALFYHDERVNHSFVPVDSADVVEKFLTHVRPCVALFIETELWATTLYLLASYNIPSIMVNARLTAKSYEGYCKFATVSRGMMSNLTAIIAQDTVSRERFIALGAQSDKIYVRHSLKWSSVPKNLPDSDFQLARPIWVMASTHAGEESLALEVQTELIKQLPDALLILVPRHPERFDEVAQLCQDSGLITMRRSLGQSISDETQVYLADSMGELLVWYQACDVAVVGGSFVNIGGHNPIEAAYFGKPVIMGRYVKNCELLVDDLTQAEAMIWLNGIVDTNQNSTNITTELSIALYRLLNDPSVAKIMGDKGRALVNAREDAYITQAQLIIDIASAP